MKNHPSQEKYMLAVWLGCVLFAAIGNLIGLITGTGFGDIFVFIIALLFIIPAILLTTLFGYPIFKYLIVKFHRLPYVLKIATGGYLSAVIPVLLVTTAYAVLSGYFSTLLSFISMVLTLLAVCIPFVLCSTFIYWLLDKRTSL